jgi:serine protease Do
MVPIGDRRLPATFSARLRGRGARVKPAVFGIRAKVVDEGASTDDQDQGFLPQFGETPDEDKAPERPRSTTSQGSGFFISRDGYAVTTNHVVEHGRSIAIETDDGNTYPARVVASDPQSDIACGWRSRLQVRRDRRPSAAHR